MTIERGKGNLLTADVDALVNTVNTQGVMGKGLALQFKKAFPEAFQSYEWACKAGEVVLGKMHVVRRLAAPRFIINFPTKEHWRNPSKLEYIRDGLRDLVEQLRALDVHSIAIPPLGCGHGGLAWSDVRPLIEQVFDQVPDVQVLLFEPKGAPTADAIIDRRKTPPMTAGRAAVLALMGKYLETGYDYRLSLVEVQSLSAIMDTAGTSAVSWPIARKKPSQIRHLLSATVHAAVHDDVHEAAPTRAQIGPGTEATPQLTPQVTPQAPPQVLAVLPAAGMRLGHQPVAAQNPRESTRPRGNGWPSCGRIWPPLRPQRSQHHDA